MAKKNKEKITIDGVEYEIDGLSDNAMNQLNNLQFVDARLQELQSELAVSDTARIGYTNALKSDAANAKAEKT